MARKRQQFTQDFHNGLKQIPNFLQISVISYGYFCMRIYSMKVIQDIATATVYLWPFHCEVKTPQQVSVFICYF